MPTGLMPNDISAAASAPLAMMRLGVVSSLTVLPLPEVKDQGPLLAASSDDALVPQAARRVVASRAAIAPPATTAYVGHGHAFRQGTQVTLT